MSDTSNVPRSDFRVPSSPQPLRLLVVEDSPRDAEIVVRELERGGFGVTWKRVETEGAVREALDAETWGAVISDYRMPHFDGVAALRVLQEVAIDIPFIIVSGTIGEETAVAAMKAGVHDYLMKGNLARLVPALKRELRDAATRRERKQAEDALRASEQEFRSLAESMPQIVWVTRADGWNIYFNQQWVEYTGLTIEQSYGHGWNTPFHPDDKQRAWDAWLRATQHNETYSVECRLRRADGAYRWWLIRGVPLRNASGEILKWFGTCTDIDDIKRGEQELVESKALLDAIVENMPLMIFLKEAKDLRFVIFNRAGEELLGHDRKALLGKNNLDLFPPEQAAHFMANDREVLDGASGLLDIPEEPILTAKQGQRLLHTRKICIRGPDGETKYLLGISEDITERKRAEERRTQMQAQLIQSQKLEAIGTLAGGVAHEINNPIMGVMNYAQLILDKLGPDSPVAEYATEIGKETERVATIVKNLLSFARVEKQAASPERLCDIVKNTLSLIRSVMRHDQITLAVDVPEALPRVKCRTQQIQQVIMNLLTNARDALNQKYPGHDANKKIMISARVIERGTRSAEGAQSPISNLPSSITWLRLTVEDHGSGIPPEIRERIFDPFFTTKPRDKGTGLGLSISHGIAKDHGGNLWVESEVGQWTRFHLDLPAD